MQEDPQQNPEPLVETGLAGPLPSEPSSTEPVISAPVGPTIEQLRQAATEEAEQRFAVKVAAEAEERLAAERAARPEEKPQHVSEAKRLNDQIHQRIIDARSAAREAEKPKPPQPASQHIIAQTQREMAEGARQSKWHHDQRAAAIATKKPAPSKAGGHTETGAGSTEVFRPHDYIPNPVKNQGHIKVTT